MATGTELATSRLISMHFSPMEQSPFLGSEAGSSSSDASVSPRPEVLADRPDRAHRIGSIIRGEFVNEESST